MRYCVFQEAWKVHSIGFLINKFFELLRKTKKLKIKKEAIFGILSLRSEVFHHTCNYFMTLFFKIFSFFLFFFFSAFFIHGSEQHRPLFLLNYFSDSRIWVIIGPSDGKDFVTIEGLIGHGLFGIFSHASMSILDKSISLMRENVDILNITP